MREVCIFSSPKIVSRFRTLSTLQWLVEVLRLLAVDGEVGCRLGRIAAKEESPYCQ